MVRRTSLIFAALAAVTLAASPLTAAQAASGPAQPATATNAWHSTATFVNGRTSAGSARIGNRLYVVGGYSYDSVAQQLNLYTDVQSAQLSLSGGVVGSWHATTPFNTPRLGAGVASVGNRIYVIGGGDGGNGYLDDVQYASVDSSGNIAAGGWHASPNHLVIPRSSFATGTYQANGNTYLYVAGGVGNDANGNTIHYANVEYAKVNADGTIGPWALMANTFNRPRSALDATFVGSCLYILGGFGDLLEDIFSDVQYSCLRADGTLGPWTTSPNSMHNVRYGAALFVVPRPLLHGVEFIVVGGNAGGGVYLNQVEHAIVQPGASNGPWTQSASTAYLPQPQWGQTGQMYAGKAYILGGVTRSQDYLAETVWATVLSLQ
ncbi:MAG: hypothetical protein ACR2N4_02545 [Jatrophihabitans sp.]